MYINPLNLSNQSSYATGLIELTNEQFDLYKQYNGYIKIISTNPVAIEPDITAWEKWREENPEPNYLEENKNIKIQKSKEDLAVYLENNPLQWTDGEYYSITQEKQNQLTSKIMAATMAKTLSADYNLTWNSTGEVCKEWTLEDLSALAFAIDKRVTKLVTYQQTKEVEMKNAETQEELDSIIVDYDSVS